MDENTNKKYELMYDDTINLRDLVLYRIKACIDIPRYNVKAGDIGGFIQSEDNLSHYNDCWIADNAIVDGGAKIYGNAIVSGHASICGNAKIYGNASVSGYSSICGNARVYGSAKVDNNATISGSAEVYDKATLSGNALIKGYAKVFGNAWVFGHISDYAKVHCSTKVYDRVCGYTELSD